MDKNFRTRFIVGLGLFIVALLTFYTFDGIPFKVLYGIFSIMAIFELISFLKKHASWFCIFLATVETIFITLGAVFIFRVNTTVFWYIVLGIPGYDVFAYLFGKLLGGKVFKKSRPFPRISKNKTWEGTILGLLMSFLLVALMIAARQSFTTEWIFLLCGPLALVGDIFESFLKRQFKVKDSNELLIKNKFFSRVELLMGGSSGHGGFLDRIDSSAFTCTVLLMIFLMMGL